MKQLLIPLLCGAFMITSHPIFSQSKSPQLEIEPFLRWDNYPKFTNARNVIAIHDYSIKGLSWGVNTALIVPCKKGIAFKAGLGYYRYAFNHIVSMHRLWGEGDRRVINYPTTLDIILGTDSYSYNTISIGLGVEKNFELSNGFLLLGGLAVRNYFTFSQRYHIPYDNSSEPEPELQIQNNYKTFTKRYFGLGGELNIGIVKKIGRLSIGPSIIIPIYDFWKQDSIFPTENNSDSRSKWLRGIGTSFKIIYQLKKNRHEN